MAKKLQKNSQMVDISSHSDKKKKKQSSKGARRAKKILSICGKVIASFILILAITGSIVITALTVYVMRFVEPDESIDIKNLDYSTSLLAYDTEGNEVEVQQLHGTVTREWVDIEQIPEHVRKIFVAAEDKRFYDHDGVDWMRTFSAFANYFLNFYSTQQGGSTITQQLIKNINGDMYNRNPAKKFTEIFEAVNLEKVYSKDQILESYLNIIPFDQNIAGIQAASKYYFNKSVSELSMLEAAALAANVKSPRGYSPVLNPEENKRRRDNYVLPAMLEEGIITEEEYNTLINTELVTAENPQKPGSTQTGYYSWFTDAVINEVYNDLREQLGWQDSVAWDYIFNGGLKIYTTQDPNIQKIMEQKYLDDNTFATNASSNPMTDIESAMVIMDYEGNVKALVGGRGEKTENLGLNLATGGLRSPGSSIKPISVYSSAVESNLIHYSSLIRDEPTPTMIGGVWDETYPRNHYSGYLGDMLIPEAIQRSTNTVPFTLANQLTPRTCYNFLVEKLHISTLVDTDITSPRMALGGLTKGMHLDELTAAYQIFGNQGVYTEQHTYTKVVNGKGEVILEKSPTTNRALTPESASIMNRILQNVVEGPNGTGRNAQLSGWTVVGKTGTATNDQGGNTDQTFIGCTPYYVAGVWYGRADSTASVPSGMKSIATIWKTVMQEVMQDLPAKDFEYSENIVEREYCTVTGNLAVDSCPNRATGYYKADYLPDYCDGHYE